MNRLYVVALSSMTITMALMANLASAAPPVTTQKTSAKDPEGDRKGQRKKDSKRAQAGALLAALDADGNGVISGEEIGDASSALSRLDKNRDGTLSHDELRLSEGKKRRRGKRQRGHSKDAAAKKPPSRVSIDIDIKVPVIVARGEGSIVIRSPLETEDD